MADDSPNSPNFSTIQYNRSDQTHTYIYVTCKINIMLYSNVHKAQLCAHCNFDKRSESFEHTI